MTTTPDTTDAQTARQWRTGHARGPKTGAQIAAALRLLADDFDALTADLSAAPYIGVTILPDAPADVDLIAAALGVQATTSERGSGVYHRNATSGPVRIFTNCPPPVTVAREVLLAQLAQLDAELATATAPNGVSR